MSQFNCFLVYIALGIIFSILFDIIRAYRNTLNNNKTINTILDIIFCIVTGIIFLLTLYKFDYGTIRIYSFLGIILGISLYYAIVSKYIIKFFAGFFIIIKKIKVTTVKYINFFIRKNK